MRVFRSTSALSAGSCRACWLILWLATDRLRVAHRSILDGDTLRIAQAQEGQVLRLVLEPFSANPQLESLYLSDTLEDGRELPLYHAVDPSLGG